MNLSIICGIVAVLVIFEPFAYGYAPYIGCYHDDDNAADLSAPIRITFTAGSMTVSQCTEQCQQEGYAYAGIRRASTCYCGNSYGRYGPADTIYCNYTCQGVANLQFCGGLQTNSIYYTIDTEDADDRSHFAHADQFSFDEARQRCVQTDGDLATFEDLTSINSTLHLFDDFSLASDQRKFWIGVKWQYHPDCQTAFCADTGDQSPDSCDEYFQWVVPQTNFECDASQAADVWHAEETFVNECVAVDIDTGKWYTDNCYGPKPFLCNSRSMGDEEPEEYEDYDVVVKKDKDTQNLLTLYIILPFFILLYGGSCVLYCVHKIYRNCKRYRKKNMLLEHQEGEFTEFEPDTKPAMASGPMPGPSVGMGPVPALAMRKGKGKMAEASRPTTSGGVRVDVVSDLPAYYKKTSLKEKFQRIRAEKRRDKLLENALKEARARNGVKEKSTLSNTGSGNGSTGSSGSRMEHGAGSDAYGGKTTPVAMPIESKSRSYSRGGRSSRYIKSPPASGMGSSLLDNERKSESPDDPTMMSIADIMRVKMMMKEKKRKVRKILSS